MPGVMIYLDDFEYRKLTALTPKGVTESKYAKSILTNGLAEIDARKKKKGSDKK